MQLELGSRVDCSDETFGKLADVVIDPTSRRVTHLVVERDRESWLARLVPVELAEAGSGDSAGAIVVGATVEDVRRQPPVREVSYLRLDGFPVDDPDWDVGVEQVLALPYYPAYGLEPTPVDYAVSYDRVPKGEAEIRRASEVDSADGHRLGHVDGFLVDKVELFTYVVLEQGPPWERREVAVPIGAVAQVETDAVTLRLLRRCRRSRSVAGRGRANMESSGGNATAGQLDLASAAHLTAAEALRALDATSGGLTGAEARTRLEQIGPKTLQAHGVRALAVFASAARSCSCCWRPRSRRCSSASEPTR